MTAFDYRPAFNTISRYERMSRAFETPMGFGGVLGDQFKQGILDSFGLGTVVRELSLPPLLSDAPVRGDTPENFATRQRVFEEKALSKEAYESGPYFRKEVPWERGMTEDRAAALAGMWDQKYVRQHFANKQPLAGFMGQLFGQAFDPINYIPIASPAMRLAAVSKGGSILGRAAVASGEAAINTAAFSVLTARVRERFGDDVSFNTIAIEIAMSALIGGAFGAGIGVLARGADARTRQAVLQAQKALDTLQTKQESLAVLNDAMHGMVTDGVPDISPTAGQILQKVAEQVDLRTRGARALENETAMVRAADEPGSVAISPSGTRVEVRPEVVELDSLVHATGSLQVRQRDRLASEAWVEETATKLNPALLMPDISSDRSAPLVGDDNIIDSGNGRVMAIRRAYEAYPQKADEYRAALTKAGFDVSQFQRPVLISRRMTQLSPEARSAFNAESNVRASASMSANEIAQMDLAALSDETLALLKSGPVTSGGNSGFVRAFLANIPRNDHGAMLDAEGNLSVAGAARLQNAIVAAAYADADPTIMRRFTEATDDNSRTILSAMADAAGPWARMRREIMRGNIDPAFDPTPALTDAVRMLNNWRDQAKAEKRPVSTVVKEGMAQADLLAGGLRPDIEAVLRSFYKDDTFTAAVGREHLADFLERTTSKVADLGAPQLFGRPNVPLEEIISHARAEAVGQTDLFAPASALGFPEGIGGQDGGAALSAGGSNRGKGSEGASTETGAPGLTVLRDLPNDQRALTVKLLKNSAPARTLDETYAVIEDHQKALSEFGKELGERWKAEFKNPGVKKRATAEEKMKRKSYRDTKQLTDLVRVGYVVKTPEQATAIINDLASKWHVVDEGWVMSATNYFDRKALVQFEDGTIGEVQFWHPDMFDAKSGEGHKLYVEMRGLSPDDPKFIELRDKQQKLYRAAADKTAPAWQGVLDELYAETGIGGASGKVSSKASSESGRPDSITSAASTGDQPSPSASTATALAPEITAGRPSQSNNVVSMLDNVRSAARDINLGKVIDEGEPDGFKEAAARVGQPETIDEIAEVYGVDKETGEFEELATIDQIRDEGRLLEEDEAVLKQVEQDFKNADAYGKALIAAVECVI